MALTMKMNCLWYLKEVPSGESFDEDVTGKCTDSTSDGDTACEETLSGGFVPFNSVDFDDGVEVDGAEVGNRVSEVKSAEGKGGYDDNELHEGFVSLEERAVRLAGLVPGHE